MSIPVFSNLAEGSIFHDRYRVIRPIRAGNMGAVYEVVDQKTNTPRALKVMLPNLLEDADLRNRFEREAQVTGQISSDHLVKVTDAGIDPATNMPFLVMELLQGHELGSYIKTRGRLPPEDVITFLYQATLALDKTHATGIVHRDLKPENLFLTFRDDDSPCIKILDFGIAKLMAQGTARGGTRAMGTPHYMAPEQLRGDATIGPATDIFALGHIAYTLLVGEPYWWEESLKADSIYPMLSKIIEGPREAPSVRAARRKPDCKLPTSFDEWFFKTTASTVPDRFERATDAVRALGSALGIALPRAKQSSLTTETRNSETGATVPEARASVPEKTAPLVTASGTIVLDSEVRMPAPPATMAERVADEPPTIAIVPPKEEAVSGTAASLASSLPSMKQIPPRRLSPSVSVVLALVGVGLVGAFVFRKSLAGPDDNPLVTTNESAPSAPLTTPMPIVSALAVPVVLSSATVAEPVGTDDAGVDAAVQEELADAGLVDGATNTEDAGNTRAENSAEETAPVVVPKPPPTPQFSPTTRLRTAPREKPYEPL